MLHSASSLPPALQGLGGGEGGSEFGGLLQAFAFFLICSLPPVQKAQWLPVEL